MNIITVVPRETSMTPDGAYVGDPPALALPEGDAVHISCVFTWDQKETERLQRAWSRYFPLVMIGGPGFGERSGEFIPGRYVKYGVTITSRGCPHDCSWCHVKTEFHELEHIAPGWIIQDDNILASSKHHFRRVCAMLKMMRKSAKFSGGLDARLLTRWHIDQLLQLRINELWFACDTNNGIKSLKKILPLLTWTRQKLRCYVMIGADREMLQDAEDRLEAVWDMGFLPFAQLYQPEKRLNWSKEWKSLAWKWMRPAAIVSAHTKKKGKKK